MRVNQNYVGDKAPPSPFAHVSFPKLPWDQFDMFSASNYADPGDKGKDFSIKDPVTKEMLAHWRYWVPKSPVFDNKTIVGPSTDVVVVDTANWNMIYNHSITSRFSPVMSREAALATFKSLAGSTGWEFYSDPSLMGVGIFTNDFHEVPIPSTLFYSMAAQAGWTYHTETTPGTPTNFRDATAVIIINLAKAFKDIPKLPNGKKPLSFQIRIDAVSSDPTAGAITWTLQGGAYSSSEKAPGRRTFPVADSGVDPNVKHLFPTWKPWPDVENTAPNPSPGSYVLATVTFGFGKTLPKIEFENHLSGAGPTIG